MENFKEKYKDALAKAKEQYNYPCMRSCMGILEEIFPELKESEDEKIKKRITLCLEECVHSDVIRDYEKDECVAWLEKQGQVKESFISQHEIETCKENNNSLTSEDEKVRKALIDFFSRGAKYGGHTNGVYDKDILAWIEKQGEPIDKIVKRAMNEKQRVLLTETNGDANIDWDTRSLQDVKLLLEYGLDYIKKLEKQGEQKTSYTTIVETGDGGINALVTRDLEIPFGAKDSELQEVSYHIPEGFHAEIEGDKVTIKKTEQKSAWIEEEPQLKEGNFYECIKSYHYLGGGQYWFDKGKVYFCERDGYLRSDPNNNIYVYDCENWQNYFCPYTVNPTWSEEDEKILNGIIEAGEHHCQLNIEETNWLKSLRHQNTWKPSDEQLNVLHDVAIYIDHTMFPCKKGFLMKLYKQLKKLKEG